MDREEVSADPSPSDAAALTALEEAMWRGETRYDLAFQERHFAADFIEFGRSGRTYNREQIIRSGSDEIDAVLPLPNLRIRMLSADVAQLLYDSQVRYDGVWQHSHRSSIWSRVPGSWVMRFHQGTPCVPAREVASK
jgi:hypothetical protein